MAIPSPLRLLLVEDSAQDVRLLREAFREVGFAPLMKACGDAEAAWTELGKGRATLPDAILLDLNLPGASGHEFLERLGRDPLLARIPVVVLTSSNHSGDVERARKGKASAYFLKPLTLAGYLALAQDLAALWSGIKGSKRLPNP